VKNPAEIQAKDLSIETFLREGRLGVMVDVRSPGEFQSGHIPGAINVPLFDDHERAEIGTLYKIRGKDEAVLRGIEIVSPKLADFIRSVKDKSHADNKVYVYCFRGGMRSSSFCWLMETAGLEAWRLGGGYKRYRNEVLDFYRQPLPLVLVGGATGSGKTDVLRELKKLGRQVVDLEGLAHHKGSAFGFIGQAQQPAQQQFENDLHFEFSGLDLRQPVFLEDESFSIGTVRLPYELWLQMKEAPIVKLQLPFEARVKRLVDEYGQTSIETLKRPLLAIRNRLGPQHYKSALEHLEKGEFDKVAEITLHYYDKAYEHNHEKRNYRNVHLLEAPGDDPAQNALLIHNFAEDLKLLQNRVPAHG
jgi:tRNA 2-selenouridine synthase